MTQTRSDRAIHWIEDFCVVPTGLDRGRHVKLTAQQKQTVRKIYDDPNGPQDVPISAPLTAYLALLHVCGPEALQHDFQPTVDTDIFTVWNATGPGLKEVLRRNAETIVCPELGTRYPVAA